MISNVLIVGGGSKLGLELTKYYLNQGCTVDVITGSDINLLQQEYTNLNYITVNWRLIQHSPLSIVRKLGSFSSETYDIIIFNQNNKDTNISFNLNNGSLSAEFLKNLNTNVLLPDFIIRELYSSGKIQTDTKVVTMISHIISSWLIQLDKHGDKAGYAAIKTLNFLFNKGYSTFNKGIYYCIEPGHFNKELSGSIEKAKNDIINNIAIADSSWNGKAFQAYSNNEYKIINYDN